MTGSPMSESLSPAERLRLAEQRAKAGTSSVGQDRRIAELRTEFDRAIEKLDFETAHRTVCLLLATRPGDEAALAEVRRDLEVRLDCRACLRGHTHAVTALAFTPDGRFVLSGGEDYTLRLWDPAEAAEVRRFKGHAHRVQSAGFTRDGSRLVSSSGHAVQDPETGRWDALDCSVRVWETATGREIWSSRDFGRPVHAAAISPDGALVLTASGDRKVRLWDGATGKPVRDFGGWFGGRHSRSVLAAGLSPDAARAVTGGADATVRVWTVATGGEKLLFRGHNLPVRAAAFSPDGRWIVSAGDDPDVRVWDAASGKERTRLVGHVGTINAVAFTPDGRRIVTGGQDRTARVWDAETGAEVFRFARHVGTVRAVAVSPDGTLAASGGSDLTVRIWALPAAAG